MKVKNIFTGLIYNVSEDEKGYKLTSSRKESFIINSQVLKSNYSPI